MLYFSDPQIPFSSNGYHPADGRMDAVEENVEVSLSRYVIENEWHISHMFYLTF